MPGADGATGGTPTGDAEREGVRALPPTPDIEFEKKRAKRLLRDARAGDASALAAIGLVAGGVPPAEYRLALAQLAVAREYGFASWPKLVQYFERWARVSRKPWKRESNLKYLTSLSGWIRNGQSQGLELYAQTIATWLPRLYGKTNAEVFASPITDEEARFIAARQSGYSSWPDAVAAAKPDPHEGKPIEQRRAEWEARRREHEASPAGLFHAAIAASNLARVKELLGEHPKLLTSPGEGLASRATFVGRAIHAAMAAPTADADAILELLGVRPGEGRDNFDRMLAHGARTPDGVDWVIARGADPDKVWPNGYSTLEHAFFFYNAGESNPAAVDRLRAHVTVVRDAFWVAASLGDVAAVRGCFDTRGRLKPAARRDRLDLAVLGPGGPFNPDADDETIIFDAAQMAVLNGRTAVLAALLDLGYPVDAAPYNQTLLHSAVGCASYVSCEFLLSRGANPDAKQLWNKSPRWLAGEAARADASGSAVRERIRRLLEGAPPGPEVEARPSGWRGQRRG